MADPHYDPSEGSDQQKVRLLISDVGGEDNTSFIFKDVEIDSFLSMDANVFRAAATALRAIAGNAMMTAKRIKFLELETDGPAEGNALRALATDYEEKAASSDEFDWAEMSLTPSNRQVLRHGSWWIE